MDIPNLQTGIVLPQDMEFSEAFGVSVDQHYNLVEEVSLWMVDCTYNVDIVKKKELTDYVNRKLSKRGLTDINQLNKVEALILESEANAIAADVIRSLPSEEIFPIWNTVVTLNRIGAMHSDIPFAYICWVFGGGVLKDQFETLQRAFNDIALTDFEGVCKERDSMYRRIINQLAKEKQKVLDDKRKGL